MASALQAKIQSLGQRLKEENEARRRGALEADDCADSNRRKPALGLQINSPTRRRPGNLTLPVAKSPNRHGCAPPQVSRHGIYTREDDRSQIEKKLQEIREQTGILKLEDQKYNFGIDDLETLEVIGSGTCGQVCKARHRQTATVMAVKKMRRSQNKEEQKRIIMDLEVVMKSHDCPFIVNCFGVLISKSDVYICMELMSTCLDKLMKRLQAPIPEAILGKMAVAIVRALHYLKEEHGVMHRDVKPSNVLLDSDGCVKLCDFGISGRLVDSKAKTRGAGCAAYMAPERIHPQNKEYDVRADVWSLGISLVELATAEFPYRDCSTEFEVLTKVMEEDPPLLPKDKGFSMDFSSFIQTCLIKDHVHRPKYRELLEQPFIKRYETKQVDVGGWLSDALRRSPSPRKANPSHCV